MVPPEFIVPPPGLIPEAPKPDAPEPDAQTPDAAIVDVPGPTGYTRPPAQPAEHGDQTVRALPGRSLPTFTPLPSGPPAASLAMPAALRPAAPVPETEPSFSLASAAGETVEIVGRAVVGRNPAIDAAHAGATPIALVDPTRTVSKTHALIEVREGRIVITDLHSTNGVAVQAGGGELTVLDPGAPAELEVGATVRLGDLALTLRRTPGSTV
ncbi:FHA domain-containing protein [Agromyces sp. PvR057]|uniref:FHA domain-containing protein n=1 Tax=Agromyces sp. PvR057 TaxID=3156403 RepID=UPI000E22F8C6